MGLFPSSLIFSFLAYNIKSYAHTFNLHFTIYQFINFSRKKPSMAQFIPGIYNNFYYKILGYFWGVTVNLRDELLDNSPRQFFGKIFLKIHFIIVFIFLLFSFMSCTHTYHLGCPGAYGMHYVISKIFMLIYFTCIY